QKSSRDSGEGENLLEEIPMKAIKLILAAGVLSGGLLAATAATAMPVAPLPSDTLNNVEQARYVCNAWGRCWWRPNYYSGYRAYGYAPRYHRRWHRGYRHW